MKTGFYIIDDLLHKQAAGTKLYLEFIRVPQMSAGIYVLPGGASDPQTPHKEDELYYVLRGQARMRAGEEDREISAGSLVFVAKDVEHRFYDVREELALLVIFAPAETA